MVRNLAEVRSCPRSLSEELSCSSVLLVVWCGTFRATWLALRGRLKGLLPATGLTGLLGTVDFGLFSLVGELGGEPRSALTRPHHAGAVRNVRRLRHL